MILAPKNVKSKKGTQPKVPKPPVTKNTDANEENGCMIMWPYTHKEKIRKHKDRFDKYNLLDINSNFIFNDEKLTLTFKEKEIYSTIINSSTSCLYVRVD